MSLLVCVDVQKKLNFDLLTLSSGSWGGGGGGGGEERRGYERGKSTIFPSYYGIPHFTGQA